MKISITKICIRFQQNLLDLDLVHLRSQLGLDLMALSDLWPQINSSFQWRWAPKSSNVRKMRPLESSLTRIAVTSTGSVSEAKPWRSTATMVWCSTRAAWRPRGSPVTTSSTWTARAARRSACRSRPPTASAPTACSHTRATAVSTTAARAASTPRTRARLVCTSGLTRGPATGPRPPTAEATARLCAASETSPATLKRRITRPPNRRSPTRRS